MRISRNLREIAQKQFGYFTTRQAISAGYGSPLHAYHVRNGNWLRVDQGLYRLVSEGGYEPSLESELTRWTLWATGKSLTRVVAISHESAIHYYGLSTTRPEAVHLSVSSLRNKPAGDDCILHQEELSSRDCCNFRGYLLTTPLHTLRAMCPDLMFARQWVQTVRNAAALALIDEADAEALLAENGFHHEAYLNFDSAGVGVNGPAFRSPVVGDLMVGGARMGRSTRERATPLRSFTLVEMLVVIAIIAVLASLLMPALGRALGTARSINCQNNLKQFIIGYQQYADLFNGMEPTSWGPSDSDMWFTKLPIAFPGGSYAYYVYADHVSGARSRDLNFWACPENSQQTMVMGMGASESQCSYAANTFDTRNTTGSAANEGRAFGVKYSAFQWPSQMAVFTEAVYPRFAVDGGTPEDGANTIPAVSIGLRYQRYAHNLGENLAFSDGHLAWQAGPLEALRTTSPVNPKSLAAWYLKGKTWFYY